MNLFYVRGSAAAGGREKSEHEVASGLVNLSFVVRLIDHAKGMST